MRVVIVGASGFVGRALCFRLLRDHHEVVAMTRNTAGARSVLGADVEIAELGDLEQSLVGADAVVNLAGAGIADKRWTGRRKRELIRSRVETTERLVLAMRVLENPPSVLISASAVGFYGGDRPGEVLTEEDAEGDDFLAEVCSEWEAAAEAISDHGVRVVTPRFGIILGLGGGFIEATRSLFEKRMGGRLGDGEQMVSWIHLADAVELVTTAITDERYRGPINATAPHAVSNRKLTEALSESLECTAPFAVPSLALKATLGERAVMMLGSCLAVPEEARRLGYEFSFETIEEALRDLFETRGIEFGPATDLPDNEYVAERKPKFELRTTTRIDAPLDEVFDFFSRAENLGAITPPGMSFEIIDKPDEIRAGSLIDYRIGLGPLPMKWRTRIDVWEPGVRFVDAQIHGPYKAWWHEHRFESDGKGTLMFDRVLYAPPAGPIGNVVNRVFIENKLREIFSYRTFIMAFRFRAG